MKILVTGAAGFIGSEVCLALVERGDFVIGVDDLNDYYDVSLKKSRLRRITNEETRYRGQQQIQSGGASKTQAGSFEFKKANLADRLAVEKIFVESGFDAVIHFAAQPGARFSIDNPHTYIDSNIVGFLNILEGCRHNSVKHLVYASSSSVYGANESMPFSVDDNVDHPMSLYAASKKSNELMAHAYSHLYGLPATGLRFFTVYGPWGRPDMAPVLFTKAILAGEPIKLFNHGKHGRDFTYIDDIVEGVVRVLDRPAKPDSRWNAKTPNPATSHAPWRIYNIGSNSPVELGEFIEVLETALGRKAKKNLLPLQPGDVPDTFADVDSLVKDFGYQPRTSLEEGITKFVDWYRDYYGS
jgi:UDP-glucuronate 4-epimerase